jgi:hypothetical protein
MTSNFGNRDMGLLNIDKLARAELQKEPFEYVIIPGFLSPENLKRVVGDYPDLKGGSYPLEEVSMTRALEELVTELDGPEFERIVAEKFRVDLAGKPKMYSLRGYCRASDGKIHTDSKDKIITVLLYLNDTWKGRDGGRLRLLKNGTDLDAFVAEVPPDNGTLLVFRRSESSWHGHESFEGVRRSIQMNWMVSEGKRGFHKIRHQISARLKKLVAA